jgi:hypothetical protein
MVLLVDLNISTPEEQEDVNNDPEGQNSGSALLYESVRKNYECLFNMTFSTPSAANDIQYSFNMTSSTPTLPVQPMMCKNGDFSLQAPPVETMLYKNKKKLATSKTNRNTTWLNVYSELVWTRDIYETAKQMKQRLLSTEINQLLKQLVPLKIDYQTK